MKRKPKWVRPVEYAIARETKSINVSVFMTNHKDKPYIQEGRIDINYMDRLRDFKSMIHYEITGIFYDLTEEAYTTATLFRELSERLGKPVATVRSAVDSVLYTSANSTPTSITISPNRLKLLRVLRAMKRSTNVQNRR